METLPLFPLDASPKPGENCSSSCPTQDHETFGQCMKAKSLGRPIIK